MTARRIGCPRCGTSVTVEEPDLAAKRGHCAPCAAPFDIVLEMLIGTGPFRGAEASTALVPTAPPTDRIAVSVLDGRTEIHLRPRRARRRTLGEVLWLAVTSAFLVFYFFTWDAEQLVYAIVVAIAWATSTYFIGRRVLHTIAARERLVIEGNTLTLERRVLGAPRRRTFDLAEVHKAQVVDVMPALTIDKMWSSKTESPVPQAQLLLRGRDAVTLANGMDHDRATLEWLTATIERAARRARLDTAEVPRALPGGERGGG